MKSKYITSVIIEVQCKLDTMFSQFEDPTLDFEKDEIVERHVKEMMKEIATLLESER